MERLTSRDKKGIAYFDDDGTLIRGANGTFHQKKDMTAQYIHDRFVALDKVIDHLAAYEDTGLTPEKIKEHEAAYIEIMTRTYGPLHQKIGQWLQAEQDGRLVVLPCKVGDTIYVIPPHGRITETTVRTFFFGHPSHRIEAREMRMIRTINWDIPMDEFGKRIFLTREEAEAALAEMAKEARK